MLCTNIPLFNGLGPNTCIQDAFNLAWKISYVMSGRAGPGLPDSFSIERQPVGVDVITRSDHMPWLKTVEMMEPDVQKRRDVLAEFGDVGGKGRRRRWEFQEGIEKTANEFHGLGIEMNQRYRSNAVYQADEGETPPLREDEVKEHQISSYPGRRLPHAWLNTRVPGQQFSTIDLAGHGCFCLITRPGGQAWKDAAESISKEMGLDIRSYSAGRKIVKMCTLTGGDGEKSKRMAVYWCDLIVLLRGGRKQWWQIAQPKRRRS